MADEELIIKLKIDNSDAMAKQAAVGKGFDTVTAKADAGAKKVASAQKKSADSQFVSLHSVQAAAIKFADRQIAEAKKVADAAAMQAKRAADRQIAEAKRAADATSKAFAEKEGGVLRVLGNIGMAGVGFGQIASAVGAITQAMAAGNKVIDDYATDLLKVKDDLKELATLKGLASANDDFIKEVATFSRATGMSITQVDEFQRQFIGSSAGGTQKGNIDAATQDQLMLEGGKVASRQTKDLATRGDLLGILSQFKKYESGTKGVQSALSDAEAIRIGLTEGRGDDAPLTKSLLHVAGSLAGDGKRVDSLPELAALIGVTSLSAGAGQADTRSEQLVRGLQGETPEQMQFLKSFAGIDEHDNLESRLDKFIPKLRQIKASGRDPATFLTENKINSEQVRALTEVEPNYELLKKRFAAARNAPSGEALMTESANQATLDPTQRNRLAEADLAAAKLARGQERQEIKPDVTSATARLVEEQVDSSFSGWLKRKAAYVGSGFSTDGMEALAQRRAADDLATQSGRSLDRSDEMFFGGETPGGIVEAIIAGYRSATGDLQTEIKNLREQIAKDQTNKVPPAPAVPAAPVMMPRGGSNGRGY